MTRRTARSAPLLALAAAAAVAAWLPVAALGQSLPTGGTVTSGTIGITQPNGSSLIIDQSSQTGIINWSTFSIGAGNSVSFNNGSGATLNRVTGNVPSTINGLLSATGSVFLVNQAGIAVGASGVIQTGGSFVASTLDVKDQEFLARGTMTFDGASTAAVVNLGRIGSSTGDVVLIARTVQNDGTIEAPQGTAAMASGREVVLSDGALGNGKVQVKLPGGDGKVVNRGTIKAADVELRANGGSVYALAGNTDGVIKATGIASKGGRIFLTAEGGSVTATQRMEARRTTTKTTTVRGKTTTTSTTSGGDILIEADAVTIAAALDASGTTGAGGRIVVTGGTVTLASGALLDASGTAGGTVLVGGDRAGGTGTTKYFDKPVRNADQVTVEAGATIRADGSAGKGGNIVVWSEGTTTVAGTLSATGTAGGGFVETSGKTLLIEGASIDAGQGGTWLLDPDHLDITQSVANTIVASLNAGTNVVQETTAGTGDGDIVVKEGVTLAWSSNATLTLSAYRHIVFEPSVVISNSGGGSLVLRADNTGTGTGTVTFVPPDTQTPNAIQLPAVIDFSGSTGLVSIYYSTTDYSNPTDFSSNVVTNPTLQVPQLTSYMLVNSAADLARIDDSVDSLAGTYALGRDIDATGFAGIAGKFEGTLDGWGGLTAANGNRITHTISNLGVGTTSMGLFSEIGLLGLVQNLKLAGAQITTDDYAAGILAATNSGTVYNVHVQGTVTVGESAYYASVGGLVGENYGWIVLSSADTAITSNGWNTNVGGLVGRNEGTIASSEARGTITAGPDAWSGNYGGLVGYNYASIYDSRAYGAVTGAEYSSTGGLAGYNSYAYTTGPYEGGGTIVGSGAFGNVTAGPDSRVGGLIGRNDGLLGYAIATGTVAGGAGSAVGGAVGENEGSLYRVSATGAVSTTGEYGTAGGLVGLNDSGSIIESYATGAVFGDSGTSIGGLVGTNLPSYYDGGGTILQSYATGAVTGTGTAIAGGLVGTNAGYVEQTYSTGRVTTGAGGIAGGLIGVNSAEVTGDGPSELVTGQVESSYWNTQTSGQSTSAAGVGLTTAQLTQGLPAGFDPDVWQTVPGQSYPYLFGPPPYVPSDPAIYDPGQLVNQVSLTPGNTGFGPPSTDQSNVTPPPAVTESGGNGGGQGGGQGGGGQGGNPGAGPPPGPGLDRSLSEQRFSGVPPLNETRFVPNEIVLQIPASVTREQVDAIAKELGVEIVAAETIGLTGRTLYRFRLKPGQDIRALIRRLEQNRIVSSAQPNYVYGLAQGAQPAPAPAPDAGAASGGDAPAAGGPEPAASGTSDLASDLAARTTLPTGDPAQYVIQKLHLGDLHKRVRGANVTVAVIDSEIDLRHPDLQGVAAERFDATGSPSRPHTHGTGMAGAIASRYRLLGVAPGVRLLAVRAFSETDKSAEATTTQVLKGLDWAIARNPRIINMSFAGPRDLMTERLLEAAARKGIVLIAAAGNAGPKSPPLYPAADPNVIAVSATDTDDKPFAQANRGKHIAVAAPGVDVLVPSPGGGYQLTTGTSVAAAHVSGIAALLIEARPSLTPADVRSLLTRTAKPLGPGRDVQVGAGLVDPVRSLGGIMPATAAPAPIRPGVMPAMPLR
ncbi:S8 family serine peptidase [Rhodoplanes sp. TEM]|uniref:S8 family serine peptidase n=1 Tax=Rhodoplanes tepidamans TaxID=200616 RepID=A0ABT5JB82_RHOTP|nr:MULTISPECIES: S8 family serine peptidase [Rhodoplanes]MDC7786899.1 S8 family serine peptidase [Rhodoplanes tepidamans]MDC7987199.1 S8 family serine peptidase [Rhodoplanes sp. TEM]MDQ0355405.1 filamentous hemagglutinin family protein [Rhodoplanes tepidamans]